MGIPATTQVKRLLARLSACTFRNTDGTGDIIAVLGRRSVEQNADLAGNLRQDIILEQHVQREQDQRANNDCCQNPYATVSVVAAAFVLSRRNFDLRNRLTYQILQTNSSSS